MKLGKTVTETLQLLRDAYGDEALSLVRVFGWHRRFILGRVLVEDDTIRPAFEFTERRRGSHQRHDKGRPYCYSAHVG